MANWKKQATNAPPRIEYLRFQENETKDLSISDWTFIKGSGSYLFKCFVIKENGETIDKIWTVWDYASAQLLKKKLGTKYVCGSKQLKVTMRKNKEEDETFFEIN